jgi:hypothetical protein
LKSKSPYSPSSQNAFIGDTVLQAFKIRFPIKPLGNDILFKLQVIFNRIQDIRGAPEPLIFLFSLKETILLFVIPVEIRFKTAGDSWDSAP